MKQMKKVLSVLLAISLMVGLIMVPASAAGDPTISITSGTLNGKDGTVTLDLNMTGNTGILSLTIYVFYKADVLSCGEADAVADSAGGWAGVNANGNDTANLDRYYAERKAAGWSMATFGYMAMNNVTTNGKVGSITFKLVDGAENCETPIEVEAEVSSTIPTTNGKVTVTGIPATIDEVTVTPSIEVNGTGETQNLAARATSAKGTDITGNVTWSVEPPAGGKGVTVSAAGIVSVSPVAVAGAYKIKAAAKAGESLGSGEVTLTVTRAASVVNTVVIADTPSATIAKPVSGSKDVTYVATAYDQYGDAMTTGATIEWSATGDLPANVTRSAGKVTVPANAGTGSFTLTATCGNKSASITVNVVDIEFTGADAAITASGTYGQKWSEIVKIDASKLTAKVGDATVAGTYAVADADQVPAAGEQTYSVVFNSEDGNYKNITVPLTNAKVNVAKKAITVTADDKTRAYGAANPEWTFTVKAGDLVGQDTKADLKVTLACAADATTAVGEVAITGTSTAANYAVTVTPGKLTITPVKVTKIEGMEASLTLSKAEVTAADATLAKLGLPEQVTLTFEGDVPTATVNATFDKTLANLQSEANRVTATADRTVVVTLTNACFPAYADKAGSTVAMPQTTITITNKYVIDPADITVEDKTATFGETYDDPTASVDATKYPDATYTWTYTDKDGKPISGKPVNAGEYTGTVTVENATHKGTKTAKLTIEPKALADNMVTLPADATYTYNKKPHTPVVTMKDGETTLKLKTDYTVEYTGNVNAGTATVTVTGAGNYTGTASATFAIAKASLAELKPTILGAAEAGKVLSASLKDVADAELVWTWTVGETAVADNATNAYTVSALDSNKAVTVKAAAAENGNYEGETLASDAITVAKVTVTGTVAVAETNKADGEAGKIEVGDVLTATATVTPDVAVTYQWFNNGEAIEGATEAAYTVAEGDETLTVTATPGEDFAGSVTSAALVVGKSVLTGTATVTASADPVAVDTVLTVAVTSAATAADYDITWLRDGVAIQDATETTYTVTKADQGKTITVKVTAKDDSSYTGELVSDAVAVPAAAPEAPVASTSASSGKVTVRWTAPADNGAPVLGYTVAITAPAEAAASVSVNAATTSYTFEGLTNGTAYTFTVTATNSVGSTASAEVTGTPRGSSSGPSGGSVSTNTKTETLADGTKVTTTELSGGVKRENIVRPNGTKADMTYNADGSATGTVTVKDGTKATVTTTKDGETTAKVTVPANVDATNVSIPAKNVKPGTVAVIVKDDGTEQIVRMSTVDEVGVMVKLADSATVKLVDNAKSFVDVPGHWAEANVDFVSAHELFNGTDATHFTPDGTMTRGMMATVLFRLDGENKGGAAASFGDVAEGVWYTDAVAWANDKGIVTGYNDTAFGPDDNVTREQLAVMIYRYAKELGLAKDGKTDLPFADADSVSEWAVEAVSWLSANGILVGKPGNLADPAGNATRAEVSAVLERFVEFAVK